MLDSWGGATDWNLIRQASGQASGAEHDVAWRKLVKRYDVPVRRTLRRLLRGDPSADEATDEFFSYLFRERILPKADPEQGRLRCFMQGVVRRYVQWWRRASSMPRGLADIDEVDVGSDGDGEAGESEREEEMLWAEAVLGHALERVESASRRDAELLVRFYGLGGQPAASGQQLAEALGLSTNAVHVALNRARERLEAALLAELREMVFAADQMEDEHRFLISRLLAAHPGLLDA